MYPYVLAQTVTFKEYEQIVAMSQIINNVPNKFSLIIIAISIKKNQWQNSTPNFSDSKLRMRALRQYI